MSVFEMNRSSVFSRLLFNCYVIPFVVGFYLVMSYLWPLPDLIPVGGDPYSIWQTIVSFREEKVISSYVLYKGFLSVYPYVFFRKLSILYGLDPFLFIKIYHATLFSFVSAVGIPSLVSRALNININIYKNLFFVCLLFFLVKFTHVFDMLMVDLPTWAFFVGAIFFSTQPLSSKFWVRVVMSLVSGLLVGLALCSSGQYVLAGFFLIVYVVVKIVKESFFSDSFSKKNYLYLFAFFVIGISVPKAYDLHFHSTVVQPMRDRGEWIPTGQQWLTNGMTRLMASYKNTYPQDSNRGLAVLKRTEGDGFTERFERIKKGGGSTRLLSI